MITPCQKTDDSEDYLSMLHKRVADGNQARMERDKRRRRVLVEQMKALQEQEVSSGCSDRKPILHHS